MVKQLLYHINSSHFFIQCESIGRLMRSIGRKLSCMPLARLGRFGRRNWFNLMFVAGAVVVSKINQTEPTGGQNFRRLSMASMAEEKKVAVSVSFSRAIASEQNSPDELTPATPQELESISSKIKDAIKLSPEVVRYEDIFGNEEPGFGPQSNFEILQKLMSSEKDHADLIFGKPSFLVSENRHGGDFSSIVQIRPEFETKGKINIKFVVPEQIKNNPIVMAEAFLKLIYIAGSKFHMHLMAPFNVQLMYLRDNIQRDPFYIGYGYLAYIPVPTAIGYELDSSQINQDLDRLNYAELYLNARSGSAQARLRTLEFEFHILSKLQTLDLQKFIFTKRLSETQRVAAIAEIATYHGISLTRTSDARQALIEYTTSLEKKWETQHSLVLRNAKEQAKHFKNILSDSAVEAQKLTDESDAEMLDSYIRKNDRMKVAEILTHYLGIEAMEPMERAMWEEWLESIRHPNLKDSILLFRGTEKKSDAPQFVNDTNGQTKLGLFSTLLSRNQGSYTRRLRSLSTMYQKLNDSVFWNSQNKKDIMPNLMTRYMYKHALNPVGSEFISFTLNPQVAKKFATNGFLAVRVDRRRVLPNIVSMFAVEFELLVPLLIFPDENVFFVERSKGAVNGDFVAEVDQKLTDLQQQMEKLNQPVFWVEAIASYGESYRKIMADLMSQFWIYQQKILKNK